MSISELPKKHRVAVLGATGAVGQAFIRLLANHPWFDLTEVAASERSAGKSYVEATRWIGTDTIPDNVRDMTVVACDPSQVSADIIFSALDSTTAATAEPAFAAAGKLVLTNAKNFRMEPDVPLVIAEINPSHLDVLAAQRKNRGWKGGIIANGNCSAIITTLPLAPIHQRFGIKKVFVVTMQAISGAGYPGVPSLDILSNVIPYIGDEEPKIEGEVRKFLGTTQLGTIADAPITVSAHANRVPVEHGHTVCLSVELEQKADAKAVERAIADWRGDESARGLPTSPERPIIVSDAPDQPQPRRQVDTGNGMTVVVGRVRPDPLFDVKLVAMGHNVVRGAAGASVLNAELMVNRGLITL
ncbi:MAG TPA: aspartate-semialdehyde dehydrogenase [Gemmatimonadaceae bacterium]|jgi:aspartate-semialdehyde dehydrogenase